MVLVRLLGEFIDQGAALGQTEDRGGKKPRDKNAQPHPSQQSQNDERGERKSRGFKNKNRNKNRDKQNDKNKESGAREEQ